MKTTIELTDKQLETIVYFTEKPWHVKSQQAMANLLEDVGLYEKAVAELYPREKAQGA